MVALGKGNRSKHVQYHLGNLPNLPFDGAVVAQLVEQTLLTPEIRGLNPDIDKILAWF